VAAAVEITNTDLVFLAEVVVVACTATPLLLHLVLDMVVMAQQVKEIQEATA
jgi:hypothetical protein